MKESGQTIKRKALEHRNFLINAFIRENMIMASQIKLDAILGRMESIMMENG